MPSPDPREPKRPSRPDPSPLPSVDESGNASGSEGGDEVTSYSVANEDTPAVRGMINKVSYLVKVL